MITDDVFRCIYGPPPHWTECDGPPDLLPSYNVRTTHGMTEDAVICHLARTVWISDKLEGPPPRGRAGGGGAGPEGSGEVVLATLARTVKPEAMPIGIAPVATTFPMSIRFGKGVCFMFDLDTITQAMRHPAFELDANEAAAILRRLHRGVQGHGFDDFTLALVDVLRRQLSASDDGFDDGYDVADFEDDRDYLHDLREGVAA